MRIEKVVITIYEEIGCICSFSGVVTKDEMLDIISAIYDMMGRYSDPAIDEHTAKEHVDRVFEVSFFT